MKDLAEQIRQSGELNPLIVVVDKDGPYILEGGHRYDALGVLGKKSFPAKVVIDRTEQTGVPYEKEPENATKASMEKEAPAEYTSDPSAFVKEDYLPEEDNRGLFHVTTAADKVRAEGLKSRKQTGGMGLGGGYNNQAPDHVSVTFDEGHANNIANRMRLAVQAARDEITPQKALDEMISDAQLDDMEPQEVAQALHAPEETYDDWDKFNEWFNENYPKGSAYDLVQELDDKMPQIFSGNEGAPVRVGFTADKEAMAKIDPEQIEILPVEARKGAKPQHIHDEAELRFKPEDLRVRKETH